ncbi:MAG: DNRLRE domain-containing protein, partial [Planctomycetaceae bacterium]
MVLNAAPTDIELSDLLLEEDDEPGSLIGVLSAVDEDSPDEVMSFHLIDPAEERFEIVNRNELRVAQGAEFDFETQSHIDVTVQVFDEQELSYEETLTLEVADVAEVVVVDASAWTDGGLTIQSRDGLLSIEHTDTQLNVVPRHALESVLEIEINGRNGAFDDMLTVDLSNGAIATIHFDGGAGGDDGLTITGDTANQVTHVFDNASDGTVIVDDTSITYVGLEPIIQHITASDVVFEFSGADETITVTDSGTPGQTTVDSTAAESVTFTNPTSSLTIIAGDGADTINILGFGQTPAFEASFVVDGAGGVDVLNLDASLELIAGHDLTATAETVNVNQSISVEDDGTIQILGTASVPAVGDVLLNAAIMAETGTVALRAEGSIEFTLAGRVTTVGGSVAIEADIDGANGGDWLLPVGAVIESGHGQILARADTMQIDGTVNSGLGDVILVDSDGTGIGLGDVSVVGGLNVTRDELGRITARSLKMETSGSIQVDRVTVDATPNISVGIELISHNSISFHSTASSFASLTVAADDGVGFLVDVTTSTGALSVDADADFGDGLGTVNVAPGVVLRGLDNTIRLIADDVVLDGQLDAGTSSVLLIDSDASGIGVGQSAVPGGINLTGGELQQISADRLILKTGSTAIVDGLNSLSTASLNAGLSILADDDVVFTNNPTTVTALDVQAADQVLVEVDLTTTVGSLQLHSDANNLADTLDNIVFSDGVTLQSGSVMVLQPANALGVAARGAMTSLGELTLRARSGITLNHSLTTNGITTVNSDTDADGDGDLILTANTVLATQNHQLDITANDIYLEAPAVVTFQDGVYPTSGYEGTHDVTIRSQFRATNFGSDDTLIVDGIVESATTLIQWDLSSIPTGVDVTAVNMDLEITNGTSDTYQIYQLIRPWSEDEATWNQASSGTPWGLAGALGISDINRKMLGSVRGSDLGEQSFQSN